MACVTATEARMYALVNQARVQSGRLSLNASVQLCDAARGHAIDMAEHDYFSHVSRDGRTFDERIDDAGYPESAQGENIAAGNAEADATFQQWWASPEHRANILSPSYAEMGIARATGGRYGYVWCQTFGGGRTHTPLWCDQTGAPPAPPEPEPPPRPLKPATPREKPPRNERRRRRRLRKLLRRIWGR